MARLASVADLSAVLGTELAETDERANRLLELASGLVQAEARQRFELVLGDVVTIPTDDLDRLLLPERPVLDIGGVVITPPASSGSVGYPLAGSALLWTASGDLSTLLPWRWGSLVTVTYDHGYADLVDSVWVEHIPDDVVSLTCAVAGRMYTNPTRESAEGIMGYTVTHSDDGAVFPEAERRALRAKYRPAVGSVRIRSGR